ncbi:MAG TPA: ATP-binding protein [Pseudomonadales bacterium]
MKRRFRRTREELASIVAMTETFFASERIDPSLRHVVDLVMEELFVNTISYNTGTDEDVLIEMTATGDGVEVSLVDFDVERFDPTLAGQVDVDAPLEDREPGGLGIFLVLKMVDAINYEYHDRQSRTTFRVSGN